MKLIASLASPYVRKVRVVMAEKKIECELVLEDVWSEHTTILQTNPLGKVPCLVMDDGGAMFDSSVIVDYLNTLTPVGKLIPTNGRGRAEVRCWEALANGMLDAAVAIRLEKQRPEQMQSQQWIERQWKKVHAAIKAMDEGLGDKPYCTGLQYSLADIAVGCALFWMNFRFPEVDWREDYPRLAVLADKLAERQSFKDTVPPAAPAVAAPVAATA
jgi:glutathione S-transferase